MEIVNSVLAKPNNKNIENPIDVITAPEIQSIVSIDFLYPVKENLLILPCLLVLFTLIYL